MKEVMEFMSRDHDRLDELFSSFRQIKAQNIEKAAGLFKEFETGLRTHIVWEEEILFPVFEDQTGMKNMGPTVVMRMEHHQIKEILDQIAQSLQNQNIRTDAAEEKLIQVLTSHNQKEEKVLYPWMDNSIGLEEREEMIEKMEKWARHPP